MLLVLSVIQLLLESCTIGVLLSGFLTKSCVREAFLSISNISLILVSLIESSKSARMEFPNRSPGTGSLARLAPIQSVDMIQGHLFRVFLACSDTKYQEISSTGLKMYGLYYKLLSFY